MSVLNLRAIVLKLATSTVIPLFIWLGAIAVTIGLLAYCSPAKGEPIVKAVVENVTVTIHSDECQLKDIVTNLPKRATWEEDGKTYEGCAGIHQSAGIVMFYFSGDKTVAVAPISAFRRVMGI